MLKPFKNNIEDNQEYKKSEEYKTLKEDGIEITEEEIQKARVADPETLYEIGDAYYKNKEYKKAFSWFHKAALQDYDEAQERVGYMYLWGEGVSTDYSQAMDWSMKAASAGNADAQYSIGLLYYHGWGVSQDYRQSMDWYVKASNNGYVDATYKLGMMYQYGIGIARNIDTAAEWYKKAANQGDVHAQYNMGLIYRYESQDLYKSVNWFNIVADDGYDDAKEQVKDLNYKGHYAGRKIYHKTDYYKTVFQGLKKDGITLTEREIQKAQNDDPKTLYKIGDACYKKKNYDKAFKWFQDAAYFGHAASQAQVGWMYLRGECVSIDYTKAMTWSIKAASKGNAKGQYNIGELCEYGWGVPQDYEQAMDWYLKAANNGHINATYKIAIMYRCGIGVTENIPSAIEWYSNAASQGHVFAQYNLGWIYRYQSGFIDLQKAVTWYQMAADNGNDYAKYDVKELNGHGYYAK